MTYISDTDRKFIENKYHRTDDPKFTPFERFGYHGYEYDEATGLSDDEMNQGLIALAEQTKDLPHCLAKAMAFCYQVDNTRIDVNSQDYFVGFYNWSRPAYKHFNGRWYKEVFDSIPGLNQQINDYQQSATADIWLDTEHSVPNWMDLMRLGFPGIAKRARDWQEHFEKEDNLTENERDFLQSVAMEYDAIVRICKRFYDYAVAHPCDKTKVVAESLLTISKGAPKTTFDALMVMYIYFMCTECFDMFQARSLGNGFDRCLYAFYQNDLKNKTFTKLDIMTFLSYFFLQFSSIGNYWGQPLYLCGTDYDGETDISELTHLILDTYDSLNIYNPKLQFKIDNNTPQHLTDHVLDMIRRGNSSVVICCVPGITKSLMSCYGASYDEAKNCDISGCNEMHIRGNEGCMISSLPNMAKAISFVFNNGVDTITGKKIGIETGKLETLKTFEDFYEAFRKQFEHILDEIIGMALKYEKHVAQINPSIMLSGTIERSLQKKIDAYAFGVKYPTSAILLCSFASSVDSLMAVKELVYDNKVTTLDELKKALAQNWEGYESLRQMALNAKHKFGNDDKEADAYAAAIFKWFSLYVTGKRNARGGVYKVGVPSTLHFISQGKISEATPDGRKKGEEFSKNVAPVIGMERKGVTGLLHSSMKLSPYLFSEAFVLDVMLHPSAVAGDDGLAAMRAIVLNYMKQDGICIQFNIFSTQMLRDAQKNPAKYKNLQVRVSGWNVLWNDLSLSEQNAYIARAESLE